MMEINSQGLYYKDLNDKIVAAAKDGHQELQVINVNGQRYIGAGLGGPLKITVLGTPGNDMAAYMNGVDLHVMGNAQDGVANTMNDGRIVIHGHSGDTLGYALRGGEIYIRDSVGYRVGIHMKEYMDKVPVVVVGGTAGDFLGEYMAGGILMVLGLNRQPGENLVGNFCGTGMHGGAMYLRGEVTAHQLGKEVKVVPLEDKDNEIIDRYVSEYAKLFSVDQAEILKVPFIKLIPFNKRPYGNMYTAW